MNFISKISEGFGLPDSNRGAILLLVEKTNELVFAINLLLKKDYENCKESAKKQIIESFSKGENAKMIKASCNSCGAGKKLYWFKETVCPCGGQPKPHTGKIVQEKTEIKPYLYVSTLEKGCPKCGGNLTKEDGL